MYHHTDGGMFLYTPVGKIKLTEIVSNVKSMAKTHSTPQMYQLITIDVLYGRKMILRRPFKMVSRIYTTIEIRFILTFLAANLLSQASHLRI